MQQILAESIENLNALAQRQETLNKEKYQAQDAFRKAIVLDIQNQIASHRGEWFVFRASGSFQRTFAYGPRTNQMRTHQFDIVYAGIVGEGELKDNYPEDSTVSLLTRHNFLFPTNELYLLELLPPDVSRFSDRHFNKVEPPLYLNTNTHEGPTWSIDDIGSVLLDTGTIGLLFPRGLLPTTKEVKISLRIGLEAVEQFMALTETYVRNPLHALLYSKTT